MQKLSKGDTVAIIAPSAQIADCNLNNGVQYLQSLGFNVIFAPHAHNVNRYMAGTDKERAQDVNWAFQNQNIKAVFCARASAGATRILPYLDYDLIKNNPKPLIGFCDNVALMLALNKKANAICWNGFSLTYDFKGDTFDSQIDRSLQNLISGKTQTITSGTTARQGQANGRLICANLSVLLYLAGTPYFPNLKGKILLIEDVHERYHKLDLMLQQLKQQPHFSELAGLIIGGFTDCNGDAEDGTLTEIINDFITDTTFPVINDFAFSHQASRHVLPLGALIKMCADSCCLKISRY